MERRSVEVMCYSGYDADEEPRAVVTGGRRLEVAAIERRWREPDARFFVVRTSDGARHVLRQDVTSGAWTVTS
ncbi:MAG TPA: hypothetical protein VJ801_06835 [Polyangia bacterium]|nr:hypothetical protein [Polyangia bacterium]